MNLSFSPSHLPISHPEYRYPPSSNPYSKKLLEFPDQVYNDSETEKHAGQWRSRFKMISTPREVHVEIGCNTGHTILGLAERNPDAGWIGIDWKFKPIFRAAEKAQKRNLDNVLFFRAHAQRLSSIFGRREIDSLRLYFPDPWPKKAQRKNRFLTLDSLKDIHQILKPQGIFHIKTDHLDYFEEILQTVQDSAQNWEILELSRHLHERHPAPETLTYPDVTLFEKLFIKDGIPIKSLRLRSI